MHTMIIERSFEFLVHYREITEEDQLSGNMDAVGQRGSCMAVFSQVRRLKTIHVGVCAMLKILYTSEIPFTCETGLLFPDAPNRGSVMV